MKRAIAFVAVLILLVGVIGGLSFFQFVFKPQMIKTIIGGMKHPATSVVVGQAATESWVRRVPAIGSFKPYQGIDLAAQVGGIVQTIRFESGQEVAKGTVLVDIDSSTEQADLKAGLATMRNADLALSRQQELISGGNTSRATVDSALATRDTAAASVDRSKAIIAQKTLAAPFAGRLGIRKVDVGQYLSPGTAIVTLTQLDPIYVDFPIPEQALSLVSTGQTIDVAVDGFPSDNFTGVVKSIDSRVSTDSRSVIVRAEVANKDKLLLPGMFANVSVLSGKARAVVTVPKTGVTYSLYGDSVYVVKPAPATADSGSAQAATPPAATSPSAPIDPTADLIVERRFVRTAEARGDRIAITDGLQAGDTIVTEGQIKLQPNAHVTIETTGGLTPRDTLPRQ
ncbi:efflux RND transporter periplasmic adaptor subunit [Lichenihabitans psoromatis]|uniref:efflux RND transporter periplasmic adaptor subunit n=1 Tax=Lichenihabitans psoromatis TaxID=2528642 RepID=UPI0010383345|nr:efflux RND transporter periplasmic adaptor subunit [Lichenihabitans psoromatis]